MAKLRCLYVTPTGSRLCFTHAAVLEKLPKLRGVPTVAVPCIRPNATARTLEFGGRNLCFLSNSLADPRGRAETEMKIIAGRWHLQGTTVAKYVTEKDCRVSTRNNFFDTLVFSLPISGALSLSHLYLLLFFMR